mgnify:CR=1 FL=1
MDSGTLLFSRVDTQVGIPILGTPTVLPVSTIDKTRHQQYKENMTGAAKEVIVSEATYADLVVAAGTKHPISAILRCLSNSGADWSALLTAHGRVIETASTVVGVPSPAVLERTLKSLPLPFRTQCPITNTDGTHVIAVPVGAEGRATAILLVAFDQSPPGEMFRFVSSAALLLRLLLRDTRRSQIASRMVRDSIARLVFSGRFESANELAAEMGLAPPPTRPHVVCMRGLGKWDKDDLLDLFEGVMPPNNSQILAYDDEKELWLILSSGQFHVLVPELSDLIARDRSLCALLTEQVPITKLPHRWKHWAADIRRAKPGQLVDRSSYRGETPSDWVAKLIHQAGQQVVEAVVEYLRSRGRWEPAAEALSLHRNTLRYRIAAAEKLLGLDFTDPTVASRLWLALREEGLAD